MFRGQRALSVIPARSGSKRLPGKNLQFVAGKPLIAWTLEASLGARFIDRTVLSTDDQVLIETVEQRGFSDFLVRPSALATDDASMTSVLIHVIETLTKQGEDFAYLTLLQPTSPLRTAGHIQQAFDLMEEKDAVGVVSVCSTEHPKQWTGEIGEDGSLDQFFRETELEMQSQDFRPSYQINGAIYIVLIEDFLAQKTLFLPTGMVAFVMDHQDSVDIDHKFDLHLADWLLTRRLA
jgi:CMP-N-acetylneuraminic acid synthetase